MSALYQGICYPSNAEAKQAACSAISARWGDGASIYTVECTSSSGPTMNICKRQDGGVCQIITQDYPDFPSCEHSGGTDMAMDWLYLVLPLMAALWGLKRLMRIFDTNREDA
ncbi:MAG: hypothetical protein Q4G71_13710 [Pseudomonadota bacterium]|nr:hypothetical protein [Pseudomonadota bacterium]